MYPLTILFGHLISMHLVDTGTICIIQEVFLALEWQNMWLINCYDTNLENWSLNLSLEKMMILQKQEIVFFSRQSKIMHLSVWKNMNG
jgi:hypothetical protein